MNFDSLAGLSLRPWTGRRLSLLDAVDEPDGEVRVELPSGGVRGDGSGYAFARIKFPGANALFLTVLVGLLIPSEVTIVPLFQMFHAWGMVDTHWPLILVPILGAPSVLATFIMRQFFLALPVELEEAARMDGLGRFAIFRTIALPLARPALGAVAIFTFLHSWNLYLEPIVFLSTSEKFTLPQALTQFVDAYGGPMWNVQLSAASMTAIPVLIVFVIAQRQFIEGLAHRPERLSICPYRSIS